MSDRPTPPTESETATEAPKPTPQPTGRRPLRNKLLELLFWIALAFLVAWLMIQNVNTILPADNF